MEALLWALVALLSAGGAWLRHRSGQARGDLGASPMSGRVGSEHTRVPLTAGDTVRARAKHTGAAAVLPGPVTPVVHVDAVTRQVELIEAGWRHRDVDVLAAHAALGGPAAPWAALQAAACAHEDDPRTPGWLIDAHLALGAEPAASAWLVAPQEVDLPVRVPGWGVWTRVQLAGSGLALAVAAVLIARSDLAAAAAVLDRAGDCPVAQVLRAIVAFDADEWQLVYLHPVPTGELATIGAVLAAVGEAVEDGSLDALDAAVAGTDPEGGPLEREVAIKARVVRGLVRHRFGDTDGAWEDLTAALLMDPDLPGAPDILKRL